MRSIVFCAAMLLASPAFAQLVCPERGHSATVVTGTSDTISGLDYCNAKIYTNAGAVAVTLPYPTTLHGYNFFTDIYMQGGGSAFITPQAPGVGGTAPTINGASSLTLTTGQAVTLRFGTDGKWYAY